MLTTTRSTGAWAALGHATAVYDAALRYSHYRRLFGDPLANFQINQQLLVSMLDRPDRDAAVLPADRPPGRGHC